MKKSVLAFLRLVACVVLTGCEKVVFEEDDNPETTKGNVVLSVAGFEQLKGSMRSTYNLTDVCTRLTFTVYKDGERVKNIHQKSNGTSFGVVELSLDKGDYEVLIIGHSGLGSANPDTKDPASVVFSNLTDKGGGTGYSDTFYHYGHLTVGDENTTQSYTLKRAVSLFRLVTTDAKPSTVRQMWFYVEGGCKNFDATSGEGVYNPRQTPPVMLFDLDDSSDGKPLQIDVFTFISPINSNVNVMVRALGAANSAGERDIIYERNFDNVPMERNTVTQYVGSFFSNGDTPSTPEVPETPSTPENPSNPDNPTNPSDPENPENPSAPTGTFLVETDWLTTRYFTY